MTEWDIEVHYCLNFKVKADSIDEAVNKAEAKLNSIDYKDMNYTKSDLEICESTRR